MKNLVKEMCDELLMLEACSKYYALVGDDTEAQDILLWINLTEQATLYREGFLACSNYLKTKDIIKLFVELNKLGLCKMLYEKM